MKTTEFFPKVGIVDNRLVFNPEAVETMDLDTKDAKVLVIKVNDPEKSRNQTEVLIMKVNGSLCDDPENIKEVFSPELIRPVTLIKNEEGDVESGSISMSEESINVIKESVESKDSEYKLLLCNTESALGKEFREQFDIQGNYYRFANVNDKRNSIGKEKEIKAAEEVVEKININN